MKQTKKDSSDPKKDISSEEREIKNPNSGNDYQQAGGNNNGGKVQGAFGREQSDEGVQSGGQGQISDGM